jgi:hypothetical protein
VNWQHLKAFVWVRWRLMMNQWRRAGRLNAILMSILAVSALATAIPLLIGSTALGIYLIPKAEPAYLMYVWDGLIVALLFFWMIGLVAELQRTEPLSLSKFMHLPVSVGGAFLINYLSSLVCLSLIVFGPIMLGYALALIYVKGVAMFQVLPLLAAFLLMLTALTYQFQGWLASLMSNPRRRRTVVVVTTMVFVLMFQIPNLLNVYAPWGPGQQAERVKARAARSNALIEEYKALDEAFRTKKMDRAEYMRRQETIVAQLQAGSPLPEDREEAKQVEQVARIANLVLPIGWLPLGVMTAAEGSLWPSLLGLAGLTSIGSASLWRAYRTTVGIYQGQPTNRQAVPAQPAKAPATAGTPGRSMLETHLPGISEPVSAVALASLRSLLRSPEAKMMLLTPAILIPVAGSMMLRGTHEFPELVRPLIAVAGMIMVLFGLLQLMGNQFGFDRDGFRVYVLCSASRRDILLGKNLAFVPLVVIMAAIVLALVEIVYPLRVDHLLATIPQYVSMFLLFCILANTLSILGPFHIPGGSLKPANPKLATVLLQFVMFAVAFPLTQALVLIPLGIEAILIFSGWPPRAPVYLVLSLVECAAVVVLYLYSLKRLGELLQAREQRILDAVTSRGA